MTTRFFSFSELTEYRQIASIDEIGRRYLAMNAFDGILTMIGLVMGSFIGGIDNPRLITFTGLATCLAMGVSGFWGAYMTEAAERKNDLRELEHAMLRDLGKTKQARAFRFAVVIVSLIDGLSPVISGATVLIPFFFSNLFGDIRYSYYSSLAIALLLLFGLGVFLARIAKENIIRSGLRMLIAGIISVALSLLLNVKA